MRSRGLAVPASCHGCRWQSGSIFDWVQALTIHPFLTQKVAAFTSRVVFESYRPNPRGLLSHLAHATTEKLRQSDYQFAGGHAGGGAGDLLAAAAPAGSRISPRTHFGVHPECGSVPGTSRPVPA